MVLNVHVLIMSGHFQPGPLFDSFFFFCQQPQKANCSTQKENIFQLLKSLFQSVKKLTEANHEGKSGKKQYGFTIQISNPSKSFLEGILY